MNDLSAMSPDAPLLVAEDVDEEDTLVYKANIDQERLTASIQLHPGWKVIEDRLEAHIATFRTGTFMNGIDKSDLKSVGEKYVIASTIANICEDIKRLVSNAAETVAEHDKQRTDTIRTN